MEKKTILLVRHADASDNSLKLTDFERKLSSSGRDEAATTAGLISRRNFIPDYILTSTALRAKETAEIFMQQWKLGESRLLRFPELYMAEYPVFLSILNLVPEDANSIAIVSHNPGIAEFAFHMQVATIKKMPTAAVFAARSEAAAWPDFMSAKKEFLFFDYPDNRD